MSRTRHTGVATWARRAHALAVVGWLIMLPVSVLTSLSTSVPFLVGISIWALVASHAAAWAAEHAAEQSARNSDLLHTDRPHS